MKVIIGAGPAGLHAAIKLRKSGIKDVVIYDPRAGNYTRPGHLNENSFRRAERSLNIQFWSGSFGHIKDFERKLYEEAIKLGIKIEQKNFVRLSEDTTNPGVFISDTQMKEEFIPADYVFDCTGSQRAVVNEVNRLCPDSPLKLKTIPEVPISHHFLAYVKMSTEQFERLNGVAEPTLFPNTVDSLTFARSIVQLRALGWNELKLPHYYGVPFGKDKVCLYFETPANLTKNNYDNWVQTVLECYTTPINYQHLPPPKKYASKPRFVPFTNNSEFLEQVSYKGKNLPTVIALGDAQIGLHSALAHGVYDGLSRTDALFETMDILNGQIYYFDTDDYQATVKPLLEEHKEELRSKATQDRESFTNALELAVLHLNQAIIRTTDSVEKAVFVNILQEAEARLSYVKGRKAFSESHDVHHRLKLTATSIDTILLKLSNIHFDLLKAINELPDTFVTEQSDAQNLLLHLANSWKEAANELFKKGKFLEAIDAYKKARDIYSLPIFQGKYHLKELPIYSNLVIAYLNAKLYSEAIVTGQTALEIYEKCGVDEKPKALYEKIIFNLIKTICAQAQEFLLVKNTVDAQLLHQQATALMAAHFKTIDPKIGSQTNILIKELEKRLTSSISTPISTALKNVGVFSTEPIIHNTRENSNTLTTFF